VEASEFDKFADEYLAAHAANVAITGESPDYFARYKIDEIARLYRRRGLPPPGRILDFGCGIGASIPHLRSAFPKAAITGLDVSEKSLAIASSRYPKAADYQLYDGETPPLPAASCDLIFSACVFHHIDAVEHVAIFRSLRNLLAPGGALAVFEHNPLNPVSRYIVATCPFDENAVLIAAGAFAERQRAAGFGKVEIAYTGFFPGPLRALRPFEPLLRGMPIGAQYYTFARR
jgi:SAM-dependent methyltransferase